MEIKTESLPFQELGIRIHEGNIDLSKTEVFVNSDGSNAIIIFPPEEESNFN